MLNWGRGSNSCWLSDASGAGRYRGAVGGLVRVKTLIKDDTMNVILTILQIAVLVSLLLPCGRK